jgi:hypothetical protein
MLCLPVTTSRNVYSILWDRIPAALLLVSESEEVANQCFNENMDTWKSYEHFGTNRLYRGCLGSPVGILTGYGLECRGSILRRGKRFFSTPQRPNRLWSISSLLTQWIPGAVSLGVNRPEREADHLPASSAEVKNGGSIPPLLHTSSWRGLPLPVTWDIQNCCNHFAILISLTDTASRPHLVLVMTAFVPIPA